MADARLPTSQWTMQLALVSATEPAPVHSPVWLWDPRVFGLRIWVVVMLSTEVGKIRGREKEAGAGENSSVLVMLNFRCMY